MKPHGDKSFKNHQQTHQMTLLISKISNRTSIMFILMQQNTTERKSFTKE